MVHHQTEGNRGRKVCVDVWLHPARPSALSGWIMVSGWRDTDAHIFIEMCRVLEMTERMGRIRAEKRFLWYPEPVSCASQNHPWALCFCHPMGLIPPAALSFSP